jgi:predicted amidophosphoribosyltransferase
MPPVSELTRGVEEFMFAPQRGPGVCRACFNLIGGYERCWPCAHGAHRLDAFVPISYSVSGGRLHAMLAAYKRTAGVEARACEVRLAAILWRYLARHEECVARAASVERFEVVTTVPSSDRERDVDHPLRRVAGQLVGPVRDRHRRLLRRTTVPSRPREFDAERFEACEELAGRRVLLIDDTWTTGASAQSAAAALKAAGAGAVAAVVVGRYLNAGWHENRERLRALERPFRWERCALEGPVGGVADIHDVDD